MRFVVENLTHLYINGKGMQNVSFHLESGDVLAVVGCNGAGKTTLLKTMCGLLRPTSGSVEILDVDTLDLKGTLSFLISDEFLIKKLSVIQMINYFVVMKGLSVSNEEISVLLDDFFLSEYTNEKISNLSKGTSKRLSILLTLISSPNIVLLDEPTDGLDAKSVILLKRLLKKCQSEGKIVIIASPILDFVKSVANKALVIDNGTLKSELISLDKVDLEDIYIEKEFLLQ